MAIADYKLTESDFASTGAEALPDKVVGQAAYVKGMIDGPSKDVIMPKYNGLIDALTAEYASYTIPNQENLTFTRGQVRRIGNVVYVNYGCNYASGDGILNVAMVGSLGAGFRPAKDIWVPAIAIKADGTYFNFDLLIKPNGQILTNYPTANHKANKLRGNFYFPTDEA